MGKYSELAKANARKKHQARVKGTKSKTKPPSLPKPPGGVSPFTTARCLDHLRGSFQRRKKSKQKQSTNTSNLNVEEIRRNLKKVIKNASNMK